MSDQQAADTPDAPWNQPDDNGIRYCDECCSDVNGDKDGNYIYCYEHLTDMDDLREYAAKRVEDIGAIYRRLREMEDRLEKIHRIYAREKGRSLKLRIDLLGLLEQFRSEEAGPA